MGSGVAVYFWSPMGKSESIMLADNCERVCAFSLVQMGGTLAGKSAVISGESPTMLPSLASSVSLDLWWIRVPYKWEKDNASSAFW